MPRTVTIQISPLTAKLRAAGFVHVTGLPMRSRFAVKTDSVEKHGEASYIIQARHTELGKWDVNNSRTVVVTPEGEVWLRHGYCDDKSLLREACPNGSGAFVPCSNGETIDFHHLLARVADPYEAFKETGENYSPVPKPRL